MSELFYLYALKTETGQVFGREYFVVKPVGWAHYREPLEWNDMVKWCVENLGPSNADQIMSPNQRWYVASARFWFRDEADRTMFILRFS